MEPFLISRWRRLHVLLLFRGERVSSACSCLSEGPRLDREVGFMCTEQKEIAKDAKKASSLVPAYLYLLGLLLAESHSDLELGLFINVHCRRWLGSSRKD